MASRWPTARSLDPAEKRFRPRRRNGLAVGGGIGIIAGLVAVFFPPAGVDLQLVTILLTR